MDKVEQEFQYKGKGYRKKYMDNLRLLYLVNPVAQELTPETTSLLTNANPQGNVFKVT